MPSLVADRRLYVNADRSMVVEEGDPRAAFLLAGEGCQIASDDVARLDISWKDGRVVYPGAPGAPKAEGKAAPAPDNKMVGAAENKGEDVGGEDDTGEDSDEWPMKMEPEEYLSRFPDGPNADLARQHIDADAPAG